MAQPTGRGRGASETERVVVVSRDEPSAHASPSTCGAGTGGASVSGTSGSALASYGSPGESGEGAKDGGGSPSGGDAAGGSGGRSGDEESGVASERESSPLPLPPGTDSLGLRALVLFYGIAGAALLLLLYGLVRAFRYWRGARAQ